MHVNMWSRSSPHLSLTLPHTGWEFVWRVSLGFSVKLQSIMVKPKIYCFFYFTSPHFHSLIFLFNFETCILQAYPILWFCVICCPLYFHGRIPQRRQNIFCLRWENHPCKEREQQLTKSWKGTGLVFWTGYIKKILVISRKIHIGIYRFNFAQCVPLRHRQLLFQLAIGDRGTKPHNRSPFLSKPPIAIMWKTRLFSDASITNLFRKSSKARSWLYLNQSSSYLRFWYTRWIFERN